MRTHRPHAPAFTLIELVVVVGIIFVMLAIVTIAVDPIGRLNRADEARMRKDAEQIMKAIELHALDHRSFPGDGRIPFNEGAAARKPVCKLGKSLDDAIALDCVRLDALVDRNYLSNLAETAGNTDEHTTGFYIAGEESIVTVYIDPPVPHALEMFVSLFDLPGPYTHRYVSVPHKHDAGFNLQVNDPFTISMWMKAEYGDPEWEAFVEHPLIVKRGDDGRGFEVMLANHTTNFSIMLLTFYEDNSGWPLFRDISGEYGVNMFYGTGYRHFVVSYNPAANPKTKFYIDGIEKAVGLHNVPPNMEEGDRVDNISGNSNIRNTGDLIIGNAQATMDDVQFYNRVLSSAEVQQLFANGIVQGEQGLAHHWPFDDGEGLKVTDRKGGAHGALQSVSPFPVPTWTQDVAVCRAGTLQVCQ